MNLTEMSWWPRIHQRHQPMEHTRNTWRRHRKGRRRTATTTIFLDLALVFVLYAAARNGTVWILVSGFQFFWFSKIVWILHTRKIFPRSGPPLPTPTMVMPPRYCSLLCKRMMMFVRIWYVSICICNYNVSCLAQKSCSEGKSLEFERR